MEKSTLVLLIGITFVFLGIFGGGFKIKEIVVPKIGNISRTLGALFGIGLIVGSSVMSGEIAFKSEMPFVHVPDASGDAELSNHELDSAETEGPVVSDAKSIEKRLEEAQSSWNIEDIENPMLLDELEAIAVHEDYEQLSLVEKNYVQKSIKSIKDSIALLNRQSVIQEDDYMALNAKLDYINEIRSRMGDESLRFSKSDHARIQRLADSLKDDASSFANLKSQQDILTCTAVKDRNCARSTSSFRNGEVWLWAKIIAPKDEKITVKWFENGKDTEFDRSQFTIRQSSGYRISSRKTFSEPGSYVVRVYNANKQVIGSTKFAVR